MADLNWKKSYNESWDDAFRGLAPAVRQQSVRVAAYTQVLFVQACADGFANDRQIGLDEMQGRYADLAYKCGMYHQLGKALVPPEYQLWRSDFTPEEQAVYRKYTTDGRQLIAALQEAGASRREKRTGEIEEAATENIPWLMQRESCQQHMERWNGSGYPDGRRGSDISPIAQIVGLAHQLDHLAAQTKSEDPFAEAMDEIIAGEGTDWNPALIRILRNCRSKCRGVYNKYIHYSLTVPKTIPLVEKKPNRPMGLKFRPMVDCDTLAPRLYEAEPWVGGIAGQPGDTEPLSALADMLSRTGLTADVSFYLLYEAADALLRMTNCRLDCRGVLLPMLPQFYRIGSQLKRFEELFGDQPVDRSLLWLSVPAEVAAKGSKTVRELLNRYIRNGITLVLDEYDPAEMPLEQVEEVGFTHVRFRRELYLRRETAEQMDILRLKGITLLGGGVDSDTARAWLRDCGVYAASGPVLGGAVTEDEMIRDCLLRERTPE